MADYCTTTEAKALATVESGLASSSDYDGVFDVLVTAASRAIDKEVGRWENYFYPSTSDESRYYDGSGSKVLWIDEWVSITSVAVSDEGGLASSDYETWSSSDYIVWPYNSTPKMKLMVDALNGSRLEFDAYPKAVKVTGVPGYSAMPPATVNLAARIQAARWFMRGKQMWQTGGANAETGTLSFDKLDPDVASLLAPYKLMVEGAE